MIFNPGMSGGGDDTFEWKEIGTKAFTTVSDKTVTFPSSVFYSNLLLRAKVSGSFESNVHNAQLIISVNRFNLLNRTYYAIRRWSADIDICLPYLRPVIDLNTVSVDGMLVSGSSSSVYNEGISYDSGEYTVNFGVQTNGLSNYSFNTTLTLYGRIPSRADFGIPS